MKSIKMSLIESLVSNIINFEYKLSYGTIRTLTDIVYEANQLEYIKTKYNELIMAVGNKYKDETRHETALRYIRQTENNSEVIRDMITGGEDENRNQEN